MKNKKTNYKKLYIELSKKNKEILYENSCFANYINLYISYVEKTKNPNLNKKEFELFFINHNKLLQIIANTNKKE